MTSNPICVKPWMPLEAAANLLLRLKFHALPVVDEEGRLAGIITSGSVLQAAYEARRQAAA